MENQLENAIKDAGIEIGKKLGESVNAALDDIESKLDSVTETKDNNTEVTEDAEGQEDPTVAELRKMLDDQNSTIDRLTAIMGKMVTKFGAQVSDSEEISNTDLSGDAENGESDVPLLSDLKLG